MTTQETTMLSLEEAKTYINNIDFSQLTDRVVRINKWKKKDVDAMCKQYRNFLFLVKKYGNGSAGFPPSYEIDEIWHNHILDTKKYIHDCNKIFGSYLHHDPYVVIDDRLANFNDMTKLFEKTQELYFKEFGTYIYTVRTNPLKNFVRFIKLLFHTIKNRN